MSFISTTVENDTTWKLSHNLKKLKQMPENAYNS